MLSLIIKIMLIQKGYNILNAVIGSIVGILSGIILDIIITIRYKIQLVKKTGKINFNYHLKLKQLNPASTFSISATSNTLTL